MAKGVSGALIIGVFLLLVVVMGGMFYFMSAQVQRGPVPYQYSYVGKQLTYQFKVKSEQGNLMTNGSVKVYAYTQKPVGFDECDQALLESPQDENGNTLVADDSDATEDFSFEYFLSAVSPPPKREAAVT